MSKASKPTEGLSPLKRALRAVEDMESKLEAMKSALHEPLAVIGLGCRIPGGGDGPDAFWRMLCEQTDAIGDVPPDRWNADAYYDPDPDTPGKTCSRKGGFLEGVDAFDAEFFGISPREAVSVDPQQRLTLEVSWETLENAGIDPQSLAGSQTGVFVGILNNDYGQKMLSFDPATIDGYLGTGTIPSVVAGRLSYFLGLSGPSLTVNTACSSSLVAVHLACQSLRNRECNLALAGGANLVLNPEFTINFSRSRMLSPSGRCRTFDAAADGIVRAEGCGMVALKRLSDALNDGDRVLAVIRGSAVNQDGRTSGLTVPHGPSQEAVIRAALENGRVEPAQVSHVETHGTGTPLGDPIEVRALGQVFGPGRSDDNPLLISSVKTNVGHMESVAGVAGLIKLVLSLRHGEIPAHLHLEDPSPRIDWDAFPFRVPTEQTSWASRGEQHRIGGVSSFSFSGTNAHVVVEEAPMKPASVQEDDRPEHVLTLSARSPQALRELAQAYHRHLDHHPEMPVADVCFTANTGRSTFRYRLAARGASASQLKGCLEGADLSQETADLVQGEVATRSTRSLAFVFSGEPALLDGMSDELLRTQPTFRRHVERCQQILGDRIGKPLGQSNSAIELFVVQTALAELWRSWGLQPSVVMGDGVGEWSLPLLQA